LEDGGVPRRSRPRHADPSARGAVRQDHRRADRGLEAAVRGHVVSVLVRQLMPDDYDALREIRLEALRRYPTNFSADPEQEAAFTKEEWLARLASAVSLGGFVDGRIGGLVVFSRPKSPKLAHTGDVGAMYVRDEARGTGLADKLIEAVLDVAAGQVEQIKLTVNAENARAIKFYERHGFREIGRIPRSLNTDGRFYDDLLMLRKVSSSD